MSAANALRIAVGGIGHETNTFSTLATKLSDFRTVRGQSLLETVGVRVPSDVEVLPTLWAWAMPGGLVERDAYLRLKGELIERLRAAGRADGVYLVLHGAMEVVGVEKAEADLLQAVREVVGAAVPISASLDLHANVTPSMVEMADVLTAYRTAPHRDALETRQRAFDLLVRCLREGIRPVSCLIKPPIVLVGEKAITDVEPTASLMRLAEEVERSPGMLTASALVGCAWSDVPHVTTSVVAVAERDAALARRQAERLASAFWARRQEFGFDVETGSIDECIDVALAALESTVFITDSGDNPTAGAPGDVPLFVERLLAKRVPDAVVAAIADAEAVSACRAAGVGATVTVAIGGKLDNVTAPPLWVTGKVQHLSATGAGEEDLAVLRVEGVDVILTARRRAFTEPSHFAEAGVDPLKRRIVVAKQGYLFAELRRIAPQALMALSPGLTDLAIERLPYRNLPRPVFPLDPDVRWSP